MKELEKRRAENADRFFVTGDLSCTLSIDTSRAAWNLSILQKFFHMPSQKNPWPEKVSLSSTRHH